MQTKLALYRMISLALASLTFSACAVLDITTLDTAVPLPAGRMQVSATLSSGMDLASIHEPEPDGSNLVYPLYGINLNYGIDERTDIGVKIWSGPFIALPSANLHVKQLLGQCGNNYLSVMPALTFVTDTGSFLGSKGIEVQVLGTSVVNDYLAITGVLRGNLTYLSQLDSLVAVGGVRFNVELTLGQFTFLPEVGIEFIPTRDKFYLKPIVGFGIGFGK